MNELTKLIQDKVSWYMFFANAISLVDETRHRLKVKLENWKIGKFL